MDFRKARVFISSGASSRGFGGSCLNGGMRTPTPAFSRSFGSTRLPLTRTSPLRITRWMWLKDKPGKPRLEKTVDAHAVLVRRDHDILHAGGAEARRRRWRGRRPLTLPPRSGGFSPLPLRERVVASSMARSDRLRRTLAAFERSPLTQLAPLALATLSRKGRGFEPRRSPVLVSPAPGRLASPTPPGPRNLLAAARLARTAAPHCPLRSLRSLAQ